jgi:hypothetical protein
LLFVFYKVYPKARARQLNFNGARSCVRGVRVSSTYCRHTVLLYAHRTSASMHLHPAVRKKALSAALDNESMRVKELA